MAICPKGHDSIADDFCDMCGRPIGQQSMSQGTSQGSASQGGQYGGSGQYGAGQSGSGQYSGAGQSGGYGQPSGYQPTADYGGYAPGPPQLCPICHTPRDGEAPFCEACGHNYVTGQPPVTSDPLVDGYDQGGQAGGYPSTGHGTHPGFGGIDGSSAGRQPYPETHAPGPHSGPHSGHSGPHTGQYSAPQSGSLTAQPQIPYQSAPPGTGYQQPVDQGYPEDLGGGGTVLGSGPLYVPPPQHAPPGPYTPPSPPPPAPEQRYAWTVRVTADREYFERVVAQGGPDAHAMRFPPYHEPWHVALYGERMRVGRRRAGETASAGPEIDLSGPPADPGISHLHVVLMGHPDGSWSLVDPGSTNGTTLNGGNRAIDFNVPVDLHDGDRIHVGAWTTLEVQLHQV
jgi:hypothetical protein